VALCRWPTTIGGWKTFEKSDGTMALKYKESRTGPALWRDLLVGPTWPITAESARWTETELLAD